MKLVILSTILASSAAFAPASQSPASSTAVGMSFENEIGAQAPLGLFDPFKFVEGESQERFDRLRLVEIKHGRVAMLAVVGYLVTAAGIRFPGADSMPAGLKAFPTLLESKDGLNVLFQFFATVGLAEMLHRDVSGTNEFVGDYRNGALDFGWDKLSEESKRRKRSIELNNGRAAQMGILGLMVHETLGVSILPNGVIPEYP